eukprot:gene12771-3503_t
MADDTRSSVPKKLVKLAGRHDATEVVPLLFIGGLASSHDSSFLTEKNITTIINASNMKAQRLYTKSGISELSVPVCDVPGSDIGQFFDSVGQRIEEAMISKNAVLVHCAAGISRSASLVLGYLMKYKNMTLKDAHSFVKSKRKIIRPNLGFWSQLIDYEHKLYGNNSVEMISCPAVMIPDIYKVEYENMVL